MEVAGAEAPLHMEEHHTTHIRYHTHTCTCLCSVHACAVLAQYKNSSIEDILTLLLMLLLSPGVICQRVVEHLHRTKQQCSPHHLCHSKPLHDP